MENWPYTNTHELNLDWILKTVKQFEQEYSGIKTALDAAIAQIEQAGTDTTEEAIAALNAAKNTILEAIEEAYRDAIADIPADYAAVMAGIADTFSPGAYPENSIVWYNGALYTFTANHSGAWTGTDVQEIPLGEYVFNLKINKVDGEPGKNLFDASGSHNPITTGYYRAYDSGNTIANGEYEFFVIACEPGTAYVVNAYNSHVCFYSDEFSENYISGFLSSPENGYTFTTPNNCHSMAISIPIASNNTFQVEKGTVSTIYSSYVFGVSPRSIIGNRTRFVGPGCEYETIQAAVNAANDGDIIYIMPGTYLEAVDATGKILHFIGAGRDTTIIQYSGDNYAYPPMEIAAGMVEKISFRTTATDPAPGAIDTAYCVHIDYDFSAGKFLQFLDCSFESPIRPTVGIGLRENFTLNFTNCNFKSSTFPVYCHEQQASDKTGQRLELVNCTAESTSNTPVIVLQETPTYTGNEVAVCFQRNVIFAHERSGSLIIATTYPGSGTPDGSNYLNTHCFYLDESSQLNNEPALNSANPSTPVIQVSGSTPAIVGASGTRYVCDTVTGISIQAPASGEIDVIFTVGNTAVTPVITSAKADTTVKWANNQTVTELSAGTYEINILDGEWGVIGKWSA